MTQCQNMGIIQENDMVPEYVYQEDFIMEKNIGSQLALYPTPVTLIGAMDEAGKINYRTLKQVLFEFPTQPMNIYGQVMLSVNAFPSKHQKENKGL